MADMGNTGSGPRPLWQQWVAQHRSWLLLALTLLFVFSIRMHLRNMPLERDEGEYAYVGQLMLQGVPPYKEACNMKLPGTYAAYAAIMAVFGQTPAGIRIGLALVNAASIVLVFLIGRKVLDNAAGLAAAVAFALLSLSPSVLGQAAHATHFITLAALGGVLLLLKACEPTDAVAAASGEPQPTPGQRGLLMPLAAISTPDQPRAQRPYSLKPINTLLLAASGFLFGLAFLMKQHGLFFGVFGASYLVWLWVDALLAWRARYRIPGSSFKTSAAATMPPPPFRCVLLALGVFGPAFVLPWVLTALWLAAIGVFPQFYFWTVTYAQKYAAAVGFANGWTVLRAGLRVPVGPNFVLWVLPWVGVLLMLWEERLAPRYRFLLLSLLCCSFATVTVGFYFRGHYFITLLPALALLTGIAVSRAVSWLSSSLHRLAAVPVLLVFAAGVGAAVVGDGATWFSSVDQAGRATYRSTIFMEAAKLAEQIRINSPAGARIAVLGSEPEVYFLAKRRSVASSLYAYPLVETHPYAEEMQKKLISEIEGARPDYIVYVEDNYSWLTRPGSPTAIFDWWNSYWQTNFELVMTFPIKEGTGSGPAAGADESASPPEQKSLLLFKRKPSPA